jgi:hypothetical protein
LERTSARGAVVDTPRGKMVDSGRLALTTTAAVGEEQRRGDVQDERIGQLEAYMRAAAEGAGEGSKSGPMELGYDTNSKIYRVIGSVPGETNEERLARELEESRRRRAAASDGEIRRRVVRGGDRIVGAAEIFNRRQADPDLAALDAAYERERNYDPLGGMR